MGLVFRLIIMLQYIVKARCVSILENKTNVSVNKSSSSSFSFWLCVQWCLQIIFEVSEVRWCLEVHCFLKYFSLSNVLKYF